jgi:hypothetical protein
MKAHAERAGFDPVQFARHDPRDRGRWLSARAID